MSLANLIDAILDREGGYVDHPADRGGPTCWGITQAVARAHGYTGDMRCLPISFAREVYRKRYWTEPGFDRVSVECEALAAELADTGVNMGPATAVTFLQRALNVLNRQARLYPDLVVDGRLGAVTLGALTRYIVHRGAEGKRVLLAAVNALQAVRYMEIAEAAPSQEAFVYGWLRERVGALAA